MSDSVGFAKYIITDWNIEQDRGRSFGEAVTVLSVQHPQWARQIAAYHERWHETIIGPIDGTVDILKRLSAQGTPLYAITNFNDEKFAETRVRFEFINLFKDIVVSATERVIKPDPEIFHILCRRNGLLAETCVFIDDSARNVEGARAVGMQAIHFTGPEALEVELRQMGIL